VKNFIANRLMAKNWISIPYVALGMNKVSTKVL